MFSALARHAIAGKVAYTAACAAAAVILVVSGEAHGIVSAANQIGKGFAIAGAPSTGAMNILVMGLESRTQFDGAELDHHLQVVLNSGSNGSQDTDTLILIHIYAGGRKAYGYSIPRDDLVTYPHTWDGQREGKIDGAYAYAYYQYVSDNIGKEGSGALYQGANVAGQQATIETVQAVTGVRVSNFVDLNLVGFYYLAQAFGGLEVCIKPAPASAEASNDMPAGANLTDIDRNAGTDNSGFNAYQDGYNKAKGGAQYLHLDPAQSLAFIRSRDTLPGVDLGRTERQQASIDYVVYELKHEGMFSDLGKLNSLLGVADQWVQTDPAFKLLDFATEMQALNGQNITFATLPYTTENGVTVPGYPSPQDINIINIPQIKKLVQSAFYPESPTAHPSASGGTAGSGAAATSGTQSAGAKVIEARAAGSSPAASPSASTSGGTSGTISVGPDARYGIPCVY
jgi:anionic cell wall polymer biosynthesis LytR-Cps2A-Psr (LCP) family protein